MSQSKQMEEGKVKKKRALGLGLTDILSATAEEKRPDDQKETLSYIPTHAISPSPYQPRRKFDEKELDELSASIREHGVLQPIVVRKQGKEYELIAGERRWRASLKAELSQIPAIVKNVKDEVASAIALIENIQRQNLNVMEEARAYAKLQKDFDLTHQQIADSVGKSRVAITNILRLMNLTSEVMDLLEQHNMEMGHARALLALNDEQQIQAAKIVITNALSVRQTELLVKKVQQGLKTEEPQKNKNEASSSVIGTLINEELEGKALFKQKPDGSGKLTIEFRDLRDLQEKIVKLHQLELSAEQAWLTKSPYITTTYCNMPSNFNAKGFCVKIRQQSGQRGP